MARWTKPSCGRSPGQSHGEDFPRIFPPFPIEVNLATFLNGENPIPFLAGAETTRLPGENCYHRLACKGNLSLAKQYVKSQWRRVGIEGVRTGEVRGRLND